MNSTRLTRTLSLTLGLLSVVTLVFIDIQIVDTYNEADGKTQAFFEIIEFFQFGYKYYLLIPASLSALLALRLFWRKESTRWDPVLLVPALLSIIGILFSSWKLWT